MKSVVSRRWVLLLVSLVWVWMAGCAEEIEAPTAVASSPESVNVGQTVVLDGSESADPQDLRLDYRWEFVDLPQGSQATLNHAEVKRPSFVADVPGEYVVELVVANSLVSSEPAQVSVTASECGGAAPEIAGIQFAPQTPGVGAAVELTAEVADPDNAEGCAADQDLSFDWSLKQVPSGSQTDLNMRELANPSFVADTPGTYVVELVVTDSTGRTSQPANVSIEVSECGAAAPEPGTLEATPANPGVGLPVQLSASPSDADNAAECELSQSLSFHWSLVQLPAGSSASLNDSSALNPSFTPDVAGDYIFEFTVTDSTGQRSLPAQLTVTVSECGAATPETGTLSADPATPNTGQIVTLSAAASDADNAPGCERGQTLSHRWSIIARPTGSTASLDDPTLVAPTFRPDAAGDYVIRLVVTDSTGRSSQPSELTVTAAPCGNNAPTVTSVNANPSAPNVGQQVLLSASASDADNQGTCALGQGFDWRWRPVSLPSGSTVRLSGRTLASPSFVPDVPGDYIFEVVVTDPTGRASQPEQITVTAGACGSRAPIASLEEIFPEAAGPADDVTGPDIPVDQQVQVSGATSSDSDNLDSCAAGQDLTYRWSFASLPLGSTATFNNNSVINPTFTADQHGTYVLELRVTDSTGRVSSPARFTVTATPLFGVSVMSGFVAETVHTGAQLDQPVGITSDASQNLYVANRGADSILQIRPSGAVSTFASGGALNNPVDITSDPTSGGFFVTTENGDVIAIDASGNASVCTNVGGALRGIFYYQGTGADRLIVVERNNELLFFLDPANNCSIETVNDLDGNLDRPWGVTAEVLNGNDEVFVSNDTNSVWRSTNGAYTSFSGTNTRLTSNLDEPRGMALTPCSSPKVVVADPADDRLVVIDNCSGGNCSSSVLASGLDRPMGVHFESSTSLVVTDPGNRAVFRITGNFCSL